MELLKGASLHLYSWTSLRRGRARSQGCGRPPSHDLGGAESRSGAESGSKVTKSRYNVHDFVTLEKLSCHVSGSPGQLRWAASLGAVQGTGPGVSQEYSTGSSINEVS